ncbi:Tripartite [Paramarasmius palmivorus]|uniref:Tripartite n=1 Tax=Paramarasmius palmivorus TaxID=297713 RepID=A0AAW0BYA7_9AGAR
MPPSPSIKETRNARQNANPYRHAHPPLKTLGSERPLCPTTHTLAIGRDYAVVTPPPTPAKGSNTRSSSQSTSSDVLEAGTTGDLEIASSKTQVAFLKDRQDDVATDDNKEDMSTFTTGVASPDEGQGTGPMDHEEEVCIKKELSCRRHFGDAALDVISRQVEKAKLYMTKRQSLYTCTLCDELFCNPYIIDCGHSFCGGCLFRWRREFKEDVANKGRRIICPMAGCAKDILYGPTPHTILENSVKEFAQNQGLKIREDLPTFWPAPYLTEDFWEMLEWELFAL